MEYYRQVKIAGEDVIEEPVVEPTLESIPGYDEDARSVVYVWRGLKDRHF